MPQTGTTMTNSTMSPAGAMSAEVEVYSPPARALHWWTAFLVLVQMALGVGMVYRGGTLDIWDALTNNLYSGHKLIGVVVFFVVAVRLAYRLGHGAPADEPTLETWHKAASHITHWSLYALLLVVPVVGYIGICYYPALEVFFLKFPGFVTPNEKTGEAVLMWHGRAAFLLLALALVHIAAALYHRVVRKDNVLTRMLPRLARK